MSETVVEMGARLLARRQEQAEMAERPDPAVVVSELVLQLLRTINERMAILEGRLLELENTTVRLAADVVAPRVRRPVRDEMGTILYVMDELQPLAAPAGEY